MPGEDPCPLTSQPQALETPQFVTGSPKTFQFATGLSRLSEDAAGFTKTLLLPGGVIGKGDLGRQAAITKTLLLQEGVIGSSRDPPQYLHPASTSRLPMPHWLATGQCQPAGSRPTAKARGQLRGPFPQHPK